MLHWTTNPRMARIGRSSPLALLWSPHPRLVVGPTSRWLSNDNNNSNNSNNNNNNNNPVFSSTPLSHYQQPPYIPGAGSQSPYGSLGDPIAPAQSVSWQAQYNSDVQRVTQNAMIYELTQQQTRTIERVVPWFLRNMPASYFQQVPESFRMDHIKAIAAVEDANMDLYLNLKSHTSDRSRTIYTFIRPSTQPGTLLSMVEELPYHEEQALTRLHVFSSQDQSMSLNMFIYGESPSAKYHHHDTNEETVQTILAFAQQVQSGQRIVVGLPQPHPLFEPDALNEYLAKCSDNYLKIISQHPERFLRQRLLYDSVSGTEGVNVHVEPAIHEDTFSDATTTATGTTTSSNSSGCWYWIDVAMANSLPQVALHHTCRLLYVQGFDVGRARLDVIPDGDNGSVTLLRLLVRPESHQNYYHANGDHSDCDDISSRFELLQSELKRTKWLDNTTQHLVFERYPWLGVARGEIITALCALLHPILAKHNAIVYSKHHILVSTSTTHNNSGIE